jgi:hypothetical protein
MTTAVVARTGNSASTRRALFDLVADGVGAGLPVPSLVGVDADGSGSSSLNLWMTAVDDLAPWVRRLGLAWQPVSVYASSLGGWNWSASAERMREVEPDRFESVRVCYFEVTTAAGPVHIPRWLVDTAGIRPPIPEQR